MASQHMGLRRFFMLIVGMLALSACRVDIAVDVLIEPDGTGTITVEAVADAELVQRVPTIADDLVLDDIAEAGWTIEGPTPTEGGGLAITFSHDFADDKEATNLLRSLGPPFNDPEVGRGTNGDITNNTLKGNLGLPGGFAAFADDDLISAVGAVPFADEFASADADPESSMGAVIRATLPGELITEETNGILLEDGRLEWVVPLDGQILEWTARSEQAPSEGGAWARPVSIAALVALIAWVGFMTVFIGFVAYARWRRSRRYRRRQPSASG